MMICHMRLQTIQYSVIGVLLVIAGLHTLFFRGARYAPLGCQPEVQHGAKLDTSLLVGIQQLRYEQRMLQADRDKLLGTAFSQVLGLDQCSPVQLSLRAVCNVLTISSDICIVADIKKASACGHAGAVSDGARIEHCARQPKRPSSAVHVHRCVLDHRLPAPAGRGPRRLDGGSGT